MTETDEMARLARANPVTAEPTAAVPSPHPAGPAGEHRRPVRVVGPLLGLTAAAALIALIAALIIAAPSDDPSTSADFDGTLRISVLDRARTARDRADVAWSSTPIDPASTRLVLDRGDQSWFIARAARDPSSICLVQPGPETLGCWDDVRLDRAGMLAERWRPDGTRLSEVVVVVPDGIDRVTAGRVTAAVHDNVAALRFPGRPPAIVVLSGPAAVAIRPLPNASVVVATTDPAGPPPAVPVRFTYSSVAAGRESGRTFTTGTPGSLMVEGTLDEAAAAMPFTVYMPDPAPTGGERRVSYSRKDPQIVPQVSLTYLPPAVPGTAVVVLEGAARGKPGAHGRERTVVRRSGERYVSGENDPAGHVVVRLVLGGTDVQINGAPLARLLAIADSLTPATP